MIDLVKRFFKKAGKSGSENDREQSAHDIRIATCALFLEMAAIDGEFSDTERENIVAILKKDYGLSAENAAQLIETADQERKKSIDLWKFTNLVNQNYSGEEKNRIVEMLWRIVYTDGTLDKHEDYLVHKLSNLLHLTHKELIDAKLKILHGS